MARSSPRRASGLASVGPTPFSAETSAKSGLRISGRMTICGDYRRATGLESPPFILPADRPYSGPPMSLDHILRRMRFRAWHRGTREADYMIGGFYDRYAATW